MSYSYTYVGINEANAAKNIPLWEMILPIRAGWASLIFSGVIEFVGFESGQPENADNNTNLIIIEMQRLLSKR